MSLPDLPNELLSQIIDYLERPDHYSLSSTCKLLRSHSVPRLLRTLHLTNGHTSSTSVLKLAKIHGRHVQRLEVELYRRPGPRWQWPPNDSGIPHHSFQAVLGGDPAVLPNVRCIAIRFDLHLRKDGSQDLLIFGGDLSEEGIERAERKSSKNDYLPWRGLMAEAWAALCRNRTAPALEVSGMPPFYTSTFRRPEWAAYLGRLERLEVRMLRTIWQNIHRSAEATGGFFSRADGYLFDHLASLQELTLDASPCPPIGLAGLPRLPLRPGTMPHLRRLELRNMLVGRALLNFLAGKTALVALVLDNCAAALRARGVHADAVGWAELFAAISAAGPPLAEFALPNHEASIRTGAYVITMAEAASNRRIQDALDGDPRLRLFSYVEIQPLGRFWAQDHFAVKDSFLAGDDQRAYDELMAYVEENVRKAKDRKAAGVV